MTKFILIWLCGFALFVGFLFNTFNLEDTKANAEQAWRNVGYEPIGYEGYQFGAGIPGYGGARVWHTLTRKGSNTIYTGYVQKWGNASHVYGPRAVNAISGDTE